ncbi:hypothetical protein MMC07_005144 [Pseudocyphellaria aurata]|nr:hypothetical protein [Pseudocyphellaria aurata]
MSTRLVNPHRPFRHVRHLSTATTSAGSAPPSAEPTATPVNYPTNAKGRTPLSEEQQRFLDSALQLRVNQAGELAATLIYTAQTPPIIKAHPHLRSMMQHMYDQEAGHLGTFNALLARHRVRPTAMYPVWKVAATALGWGTAMMGREAAMACTEAVETEIGTHYNGQVRELLAWLRTMEEKGERFEEDEELQELIGTLKRIRDEELEHLDTAVGEDAKKADGYGVLNWVVRGGCRGAIWISERV